jgi:hypothetical protein
VSRAALAALLIFAAGLAIAPPSISATGAAKAAAPARRAAAKPFPIDSLQREDHARARLIAPDFRALVLLRRETEYASNQFRRYMGPAPPKIGIAALGSMADPSRVSAAELKLAGYENVLADWPDPAGVPRAAALGGSAPAWRAQAPERISRWFLFAFEREQGRGTPAEGRARFVPDWFESGLAGLATHPSEQNVRLAWMHARMDQRIPMSKFLTMARPAERPASGKAAASPAAAAGKAGASPAAVSGKAAAPSPQLFDAQALSFAKFLGLKEHERFLGLMLEKVLVGEPQLAAFGIAKNLLPHPDVLEKEWVAWVSAGAGPIAPPEGTQ